MESEIAIVDMVLRLLAAAGLASVIGLERELRQRPAGLRTHMLVSLGAAGFMLVGYEILFATAVGDPSARIDPTRIVEGVIGGIGFLGAGSIIQGRGSIQGITTGAAIWIAGTIGVARDREFHPGRPGYRHRDDHCRGARILRARGHLRRRG